MKKALLFLWLFLFGALSGISEEVDPAAKWLNVYSWIQTADRLSEAEQWPLALGSYMEAHRQLKKMADDHPSYEPDIVAYRLERLEDSMAIMEGKLTAGDHDIAMEWVDFIETFEKGQDERFSNDFKTAFETLEVARTLLEGIIAQNPNGFEAAVATQFEILTESLEYLDSQLNFQRSVRRSYTLDEGIDWGTTRYVKESDLPGDGDAFEVNSMLFPDGVKPIPEKSAAEEAMEEGEDVNSPGRIRMNTKVRSDPSKTE